MQKIIIANWKMQLNLKESLVLAKALARKITKTKNQVLVCPDYLALPFVGPILKSSPLILGAQDSAAALKGAYTGEVSAFNLKTLGVKYVILGHSERRSGLHENSAIINAKIKTALGAGLIPVLCVGEKLAEKKAGLAKKYLSGELSRALKGVKIKKASDLIIAYEPLWAIGTGVPIVPTEAEDINKFIKRRTAVILKKNIPVLYGGSVDASNAANFLGQPNVDGLLVGGASLKAEEFSKICRL
ncbi:MAG: triose-phosphate isomerase [Patescibacteria group bacterium]